MSKKVFTPEDRLGGLPDRSCAHLEKYRNELGDITRIELDYDADSLRWETTVVGTTADLCLTGFSAGYKGTGPLGLRQALLQVGFIDPELDAAQDIEDTIFGPLPRKAKLVFVPGAVKILE